MARYIDADELIRLIEIDALCNKYFSKRDVIASIKAINTADVAPKSEYEKAVKIIEQVNRLAGELKADLPFHNEMIKTETAREIFEEIEIEIKEALNSNYIARPHIAESEELYHIVEGKITALSGIEDFIAELKKKYIGE